MSEFTMSRDFVVSGFGHHIEFKAGVPMHVPPALHSEAMRCGATPTNPEEVIQVEKPVGRIPEAQGQTRVEHIMAAMDQLVINNNRMSFGANGLPTTKAIYRLTGIDIEENERNAIWNDRQSAINAKNDPSNVTEAQEAEATALRESQVVEPQKEDSPKTSSKTAETKTGSGEAAKKASPKKVAKNKKG